MRVRTFISDRVQGPAPIGLILSLALLAVSFGACTRQNGAAARYASTDNPPVNNGPINNSSTNTALPSGPVISYADVVTKVAPAVVTIHSTQRVRQPQQFPFMNDPFFQQFFGNRGVQQPPPS